MNDKVNAKRFSNDDLLDARRVRHITHQWQFETLIGTLGS